MLYCEKLDSGSKPLEMKYNCTYNTLIEKDHLGDRSPEKDCC